MKITYIPNKKSSFFDLLYKTKKIQSICIDFSKTMSTVCYEFVEDGYVIRLMFDVNYTNIELYKEMIKHHILSRYDGVVGFLSQPKLLDKCSVEIHNLISLYSGKIVFNNILPKDKYELKITCHQATSLHMNSSVYIEVLTSKINQRHYDVCGYCGSLSKLTKEHVIPKVKQMEIGTRIYIWCCSGCNSTRGTKEYRHVLTKNHWFLKFLTINYGGTSIKTLIKNSNNDIKVDVFSDIF